MDFLIWYPCLAEWKLEIRQTYFTQFNIVIKKKLDESESFSLNGKIVKSAF